MAVSPFFKFAFDNPFDDSGNNEYKIGSVQSQAVATFVEWLYSRKLRRPSGDAYTYQFGDNLSGNRDEAIARDRKMKQELIDLYVLADQYDIPQLRRDVTNAFMKTCTLDNISLPNPSRVKTLCNRLPMTAPLVQFLIDLYSFAWDGLDLEWGREEYPSQFLAAVLEKIVRAPGRQPERNPLLHACDYHEHGDLDERVTARSQQTKEKEVEVVEETQLKD